MNIYNDIAVTEIYLFAMFICILTRLFKSISRKLQIFIPSNRFVIADLKTVTPTKFLCFYVYLHTKFHVRRYHQ